jgi:polysaccharide biosynthesis/export protein
MSALTAAALLLLLAEPPAHDAVDRYRVGPGDLLEVVVEGRPDLGRLPTVQTTGTIWLPRAGEIEVRGLSAEEIAARIAPLVAGPDLEAPLVTVRVQEHHSQFVWTRGALARPGRKQLRGGTRLVDVLLDSGGFLSGASSQIVIERTVGAFEDGSRMLTLRFSRAGPSAEDLRGMALPLAPGDVVTAPAEEWIVVSGAVKRPGRCRYDAALTLSRAVEGAGGLLPTADRRVRVRRVDSAAGAHAIEADLDAIRRGSQEDVVLLPGDEIAVEARHL